MTLRPFFGFLHRWVGLLIAGFLIVSGLTGAVISWDHELDDLLNPHLMHAPATGPALPALDLAAKVEAADPRVRVSYLPLAVEAGESLAINVEPRIDPATKQPFKPGYNQIFVDPATGARLGAREWGAVWPITTENVVSFLYVFHYSLHLPAMWGIDRWGIWLLGGVAILWTLDTFVGFYLTLPTRQRGLASTATRRKSWRARWAPAWQVKTSGSAFRINFDLHRAFGLWLWGLLFMLAFTAFSLNLYREVFLPVLSTVSRVTPTPFDTRTPAAIDAPIAPRLGFAPVLARARAEAAKRGWAEPAGSVYYAQSYGIYGVAFFRPEDGHGAGGVGHRELYYDGGDGRLLGDRQPWVGTAADIFVQAQFPLHSGRILGLPGRILISVMGVVVAGLSVTGIVIWARKRRSRRVAADRRPPVVAGGRLQPAE